MAERIIDYRQANIERAERLVLKDIDFTLETGEFCYLVGRVGSGKSSLMKTMYADIPVRKARCTRVLDFDVASIRRRNIPMLRREIGIVFQDFQLLQDRSVSANLRFVLQATGWRSRRDMESRIDETLSLVGMADKSYKMPHELSGGEQQRVVIARALLNRPRLILADEPTGNLDPETGRNIVALLHELSRRGHGVIMATHNIALADEFPARVVECYERRLIDH